MIERKLVFSAALMKSLVLGFTFSPRSALIRRFDGGPQSSARCAADALWFEARCPAHGGLNPSTTIYQLLILGPYCTLNADQVPSTVNGDRSQLLISPIISWKHLQCSVRGLCLDSRLGHASLAPPTIRLHRLYDSATVLGLPWGEATIAVLHRLSRRLHPLGTFKTCLTNLSWLDWKFFLFSGIFCSKFYWIIF